MKMIIVIIALFCGSACFGQDHKDLSGKPVRGNQRVKLTSANKETNTTEKSTMDSISVSVFIDYRIDEILPDGFISRMQKRVAYVGRTGNGRRSKLSESIYIQLTNTANLITGEMWTPTKTLAQIGVYTNEASREQMRIMKEAP